MTGSILGSLGVGLAVGFAAEDWSGDARYFEYSRAANPVGSGHTPKIPMRQFPASLHAGQPTGIIELDQSTVLGIDCGPATSPALCAAFVRIEQGEQLDTAPVATSELCYVMTGRGRSQVEKYGTLDWGEGDVFVLPGGAPASHHATADTTLYRITDEPLLRYLGVRPSATRFAPTHFPAHRIRAELNAIVASPRATDRNRLSVLLANADQPQTLTATHVLWAMFGLLPVDAMQKPHRHQSVALDLIVDCRPGCYTLVGRSLDEHGRIVKPERVDWEAGGAFVTPPGLWHSHHNESGADAHLLPVQDAGLHTYLRTLDIRFS